MTLAAAPSARSQVGVGQPSGSPLPTGNLVPQGSPIPRILPPAPPAVGPGLPPAPAAPRGAAVPAVNVAIRAVLVEGSTAYPQARLAALAAGLTGAAVPLARIEQARRAILDLYRADGFVLTAVSATIGRDGTLRFVVTEGRIADVKLEGNIGPAGTQVLRFLNHLTERVPIDAATLERWLLLAQDVPGVSVRAVLRPSAGQPGALELVAQVSRQKVNGLLTIDNRAFKLTGPQQGLAVVDFNSFTEFGEQTELSLYDTNGSTQIFGQAAVSAFVGGSGLRVRAYGGTGRANPFGALAAIGYSGTTTVGGIAATYPLIRRRTEALNLAFAFDTLDARIDTNTGPNGATVPASKDSLRVLRWAADYARQDLLAGDSRPGVTTAELRLSQGLTILGASQKGAADAARIGENPGFFKVNGEFSRSQALFQPWPDASVSLYGLLGWQWSDEVLPPSEKFFLGGNRLNRGFYSGEVTGDKAVSASVELRLDTAFALTLFGLPVSVLPEFYLFYDWGYAWQNQTLDPNGRLASAGGGLRLPVTRYFEVDVEGVSRFTLNPYGASANVEKLKSNAVYWRVLARF